MNFEDAVELEGAADATVAEDAEGEALPAGGGFETAWCASCQSDVLVAMDLDAQDAWIRICARCDTPVEGPPRRRSAEALVALGFDLDKVPGEGGGCGSGGGCVSCS